jgi:hypothetical protein
LDLDTSVGRVFFQQKWFYTWRLWPGVAAPWSYHEKLAFHTRVDRAIWRVWSNHVHLRVAGQVSFAGSFAAAAVPINFDVKWSLHVPFHWKITAWKVPAGSTPTAPHRSFVNFALRTMELNTADIRPRPAGNAAGAIRPRFETPPHELVHTLDNPDEYGAGSPHLGDTDSLANIGKQVRGRHLHLVLTELDRLVPGAHFTGANVLVVGG